MSIDEGMENVNPLISLLLLVLSFWSIGSTESALIVEVEVDRPPREFFKGPRWVSLNSMASQSRLAEQCQKAHSLLGSKT